ncbi:MAG: hypothetical protein ACT4QE_24780, partial [Anaerolineales bacterium]
FFFPFVLAATLAPLRLNTRATGLLAVALMGVWFTLMKTSPEVAALTEAAVTRLTGWPARIVLDPTDLFALISLWPAWRLWVRARDEAPRRVHLPRRVEWMMLGIASLAALASSCPGIPSADRVAAQDGILYVKYSYSDTFAVSADGGRTWGDTKDLPPNIAKQLEPSTQFTSRLCDPLQDTTCYRITGRPEIEQSLDSGATWQAIWELPAGRADFMRRYVNPPDVFAVFGSCATDFAVTTPTSLALVTLNGQTSLVATMQSDGLLVQTPEGHWERLSVWAAEPLPYAVSDARAFSLMLHETLNWLGGALLTFWLIMAWHRRAVLTATHSRRARFAVWVVLLITLLLLIAWLINTALLPTAAEAGYLWPNWLAWAVLIVPIYALLATMNNFWLMIGAAVVVGLIVIGLLRLIIRFWRSTDWPIVDSRVARAGLIIGVALLILSYLPFPFWAWGVIAHYNTSRYLALVATGLVWLMGGLWVWRVGAKSRTR